jgi:hypothetical protein
MAIAAVLDTLTISKRFEDAGFTKQQADLQAKILVEVVESNQHEESIKHEIDASESRIEKAMKEMEIRIVREISQLKDDLRKEMNINTASVLERVHKVEINLSFINRIGGFVLALASFAAIIVSIFHLHISFT